MADVTVTSFGLSQDRDFANDLAIMFYFASGFVADSTTSGHITFAADVITFAGTGLDGDTGIVTDMSYKHGDDVVYSVSGLNWSVAQIKTALLQIGGDDFRPLANMLHDLDWNVDASATAANLTVFGGGGDDVFLLGSGDDRFYAGGGNDRVSLGAGDDEAVAYNYFSYHGHPGTTKVDGGAGFDWMDFENGQGTDVYPVLTTGVDIVMGEPVKVAKYKISFSNFEGVEGTSKADTFFGSNNADYYVANGGGDLITGRAGGDTLVGGAGEDAFIYHKVSDSAGKHIDRIGQFQHDVDYFDLSALTPDTKNGRFRFVGYDDLQKAGDLHYIAHNERGFDHDYTMIEANIDDKGGPDFKIKIIGVVDLGPGDLIL